MTIPDDQLKQLLLAGHITNEIGLTQAQGYAKDAGISLSEALIEKDIVTDERLGQVIASHLQVPFVTVAKMSIPDEIIHIVPPRIAKKHKIVPFERDANGIK